MCWLLYLSLSFLHIEKNFCEKCHRLNARLRKDCKKDAFQYGQIQFPQLW
jgi:hypothetical protein